MPSALYQNGFSTPQTVVVITCSALALYNAIELLILIFTTFKRWSGLYFWSLLVASFGVIPYNVGFLISSFKLKDAWLGFAFSTYGWITMVTGQSVVLYSRLHCVSRNDRLMKAVKWMIIVDAVVFHIPTTVMLFGSHLGKDTVPFGDVYKIYEKVQMTGFCIQEFIISGVYLQETVGLLKILSRPSARRIIQQLLTINIIIIALDIVLLSFEYRNQSVLEQTTKGLIYSVKLKFEFAILGKLVTIVESSGQSLALTLADTTDIVKTSTHHTNMMGRTATNLERKTLTSSGSPVTSQHREEAGFACMDED